MNIANLIEIGRVVVELTERWLEHPVRTDTNTNPLTGLSNMSAKFFQGTKRTEERCVWVEFIITFLKLWISIATLNYLKTNVLATRYILTHGLLNTQNGIFIVGSEMKFFEFKFKFRFIWQMYIYTYVYLLLIVVFINNNKRKWNWTIWTERDRNES